MHRESNNNCPKNADPRNETCSCDADRLADLDAWTARTKAKHDDGICAYGNCQNKVVGDRLYCEECRDNL